MKNNIGSDLASQLTAIIKAEAAKLSPQPKVVRHSTSYLTADEKRTVLEMLRDGKSISRISKQLHRNYNTINDFAVKHEKSAIATPTPTPLAVVESIDDTGIGSVKRSIERLHDRVSKLDKQMESVTHRLSDITAMVAKVQATCDRVVREFVDTNPAPAEIIIPTARNGNGAR